MITEDVLRRAEARAGRSLNGRYTLDGVLAVGGTAAVYAARGGDGARFALKILHSELSAIPDVCARFRREAYVANRVGPPGVAQVVDDGVDEEGCAYLVLELLEGQTLANRQAENGSMPPAEVVHHATRVLDVLDRAHSQGIVHRDIKPANLFLCNDGTLSVLDFGIARLVDGPATTRSGQTIGTLAFMSPEQAGGRNREVGARSDIWSVGATMFALLSGRCVHEGRSPQQQTALAATQAARRLRDVAPSVSPGLAAVVDRALEFESAARWPSAGAMRDALRRTEP